MFHSSIRLPRWQSSANLKKNFKFYETTANQIPRVATRFRKKIIIIIHRREINSCKLKKMWTKEISHLQNLKPNSIALWRSDQNLICLGSSKRFLTSSWNSTAKKKTDFLHATIIQLKFFYWYPIPLFSVLPGELHN